MIWNRVARVAVSLAVCGSALGCHGYFPLRAPQRELWVAAPAERPPLRLPSLRADREPGRDDHDGVSVVVKVLEFDPSRALFQADLPRHHIQPLLLLLRNGGGETYLFRKAAVGARYLHAEAVARMVYQHPSVTLIRYGKWLAMLLPGLLFETVIEPTTTFDFPGIEEAAQRPTPTDNARIRAAFVRYEIPDGPLAPDHTLEGALFVRPFTAGSPITVTLTNARTGEPLRFRVPTPPPIYSARSGYSASTEVAWTAAVEAARHTAAWQRVAVDTQQKLITAHQGVRMLGWRTAVTMTVSIHPISDQLIEVEVQSTLPRPTSDAYGRHPKSIEVFFGELSKRLPPPPQPRRRRKRVPSSSAPQAVPSADATSLPSY